MNKKLENLLQAHIDHEMKVWEDEASLRKELEFLFDWALSMKIGDVLSRSQIDSVIKEIRETSATEDTRLFFTNTVQRLRKVASESKDTTATLTTKEIHDSWVEVLIKSNDLRSDIGRDFARSLFFKKLISEVLYFSIRRFLSEDNMVAKSIPGMSSLFKFGQDLVNKTMPSLDENVSRIVRDFISRNMDSVSGYAETVLTSQMDEKMIRELADGFWNDMADRPISKLAQDLLPLQDENVSRAAEATWDHFRKTDFFEKIVHAVLESWFDHYETMDIKKVLENAAVSRQRALDTIFRIARHALQSAAKNGKLRELLRRRLSSFYESPAAESIVGG